MDPSTSMAPSPTHEAPRIHLDAMTPFGVLVLLFGDDHVPVGHHRDQREWATSAVRSTANAWLGEVIEHGSRPPEGEVGVPLISPRVFRTLASMPASPLAISDRPEAGLDRGPLWPPL